jgi:SAM-dependent methyltransferase
MPSSAVPPVAAEHAVRLDFVVAGQEHTDHYLSPLADPAGKSVLVVGCGAGTDVLWCLRHGAAEVVGIDLLEQEPGALAAAARRFGVDAGRASFRRLAVDEAPRLGRRFDLVLSNNVFEHVGDLAAAFAACAEVVEPGSGRLAVFSSPLWLSSGGSHLPHAPWEHLWADSEDLRRRLLAGGRLPAGHALERLDLATYLDREITLNRARVADFVAGIAAAGLAPLHLSVLPDPHLAELPAALARLRAAEAARGRAGDLARGGAGNLARDGAEEAGAPSAFDLGAAGVAVELARPPAVGEAALAAGSTFEARLAAERRAIHGSLSFRLGRAITAPARRLRAVLRPRRDPTRRGGSVTTR